MGDSKKRCEECNTPIDDGKLCSGCSYAEIHSSRRLLPRELQEMKRQGERFQADLNKTVADFTGNECSLPPSTYKKD